MFFAVLPFVLLFVLVVGLKWSALKAMPLVWLVTLASLFFVWKVDELILAASFVKGIFVALEITLILFGAVWLVEIVREKKHFDEVQDFLSSISSDARVQVVIIAWLFGSLIEGVAGFGTPAMIVAPLLVSIGFPAVLAVVISLISNSTAVSFGAVGTPINIGLGSLGFERELLESVSVNVALIHSVAALIVPLAITFVCVSAFGRKNFWKNYFAIVPFCFLSWIAFVVPYFLTAFYLGTELPSIVGSVFALIVVSLSARAGFLIPKEKISFVKTKKREVRKRSLLLAVLPYVAIVSLLFVSRFFSSVKIYLSSISIEWSSIFGSGLSYAFQPFFVPSFYFILTGIFSLIVYRANRREVSATILVALNRAKRPFFALVFALGLVQLFLVSSQGSSGIEGMHLLLANSVSGLFGEYYVFVSPFIGVFGAFVAGSNTVSNLLFGAFQAESAALLGLSIVLILALQVVGGAVGNMIAIHNVLAASSTVGIYGREGEIIRRTIKVCLIYALVVALIGFFVLS